MRSRRIEYRRLAWAQRILRLCPPYILLALAAQPAVAADQALIAAAKKEGQVTWYTTQILTQFGRPAIDAFQKRYGIRVDAIRGDSVELAVRMTNEAKAGRVQADVFDGTATTTAMKNAGAALQWQPDGAKQLPKELWDPQGYWVATNEYVHTPAYNTNLVPKGSEPKSWQDLFDPKWKGKLAWATHATTSGGPGFVGLVLAELGEEKGKAYLRQLAKQDVIGLGGSARSIVDQAIAGEYPIVLQIFDHQPFISAEHGAPIDFIQMNPAMVILSSASVTKDAPHPNAGKLLIDFFISEEGQKIFRDVGYVPIAPNVPPRNPALRPDGKTFRGIFFSPEQVDTSMPHWLDVYNEIFR
jgi:iron(III) transport system substrate-binding protein